MEDQEPISASPTMREFYAELLKHQTSAFSMSASYNQIIILAGYAAFFAVWSAMIEKISAWAGLAAGALILVSVIVYVGWTIGVMVITRLTLQRASAALTPGMDGFYERALQAEEANLRAMENYNKHWKPVVIVAGGSALFAALIIVLAAIEVLASPLVARFCAP